MAELIDLKASKVQERQRQVGTYGTQTPLASTAVERGSTRWLNGSSVAIEGLLDVSGTLTGDGDFNWSGSLTQSGASTFSGEIDLNGPVNIAGDVTSTGHFTQTGPTDLNGETTVAGNTTVTGTFDVDGPMKTTGNLEVSGTMDIKGAATLNNDLTVAAGKKIKLGGLTMENTGTGGGTINFPNGSLSSGSFGMLAASSVQVEIGAPLIKLSGIGTIGGVTPNLYIDGNGQLKKIT